jgi:hypothetical protein
MERTPPRTSDEDRHVLDNVNTGNVAGFERMAEAKGDKEKASCDNCVGFV